MRHGDELGVELNAIADRPGERGRQPIVAAGDAVHRRAGGLIGRRELIDERDDRQLLGIGEEEAAQAGGGRPQVGVRPHIVEPLRDRPPREVGGDRRVPALLGQTIAPREIRQTPGQLLPAALRALNDPRAARAVAPHVAEAAAQDARQLQPELAGERPDLVLRLVDHVAAGFGVLALGEAVADRPHAAADAVARLDHRDVGAFVQQIACGGETGKSSAGNEH